MEPFRRRVKIGGGLSNPCGEIVLSPMRECNLGYRCTSCEMQIVATKDGICGRCLQEAEFVQNTPWYTKCGVILDSQFYCLDCGDWFSGFHEPELTVCVGGLGIYSQICICCRKVVLWGALPLNKYAVDYSNSRRVLGV
jgi:hypothetical protein